MQSVIVHLVIQCLGSPLRHFNQEADFHFRVSDILNEHSVLFNLNIGHVIHREATAPCFFWSLDDLPFDDPANCLEDFSDWPQGLVSEMFQFFQAYRPYQLQHGREFSIGSAIQKSTVQYVMLVDIALINFFLRVLRFVLTFLQQWSLDCFVHCVFRESWCLETYSRFHPIWSALIMFAFGLV